MKKLQMISALMILLFSCSMLQAMDFSDEVLAAKSSIKGKMIVSHIDFLASKYCRGREAGDYGLDVASKYIRSILKGAEVEPAGEYGNYFQDVRLKTVDLSENVFLKIRQVSKQVDVVKNAKLDWEFLPVSLSAEKQVTAGLVFAGYGISAPEHKYDDYKGLKAEGKIVMVLRHEPGEKDPDSPFDGRKNSEHGTLLTKILNAQKHGAVGVLFVTDPLSHDELSPSACGGTYWPSLRRERWKDDEDFKFMDFSPSMRLADVDYGVNIPAVAIDIKLAEDMLGDGRLLRDIQREIDKNLTPHSFAVDDKSVTMSVQFKNGYVDAQNIVAKVTGSDPVLKDEVVIVGGHYDHVGKDKRGRVFGGADDNASGTAGVLELARAFQNLPNKPKRTMLFILFTAEEKGLYGSRYYVEHPIYPLDKTLAMINLDMIGRNDVDQISLIGRYQYPKLYQVIDELNRSTANMEINFSIEQYIRQSDHFPFMRKKVPTVFFNSGMHDQLHRPEDQAWRINPEKIEKVTQLVFLSLWELANVPAGTQLK